MRFDVAAFDIDESQQQKYGAKSVEKSVCRGQVCDGHSGLSKKFDNVLSYRLDCGLHPAAMTTGACPVVTLYGVTPACFKQASSSLSQ